MNRHCQAGLAKPWLRGCRLGFKMIYPCVPTTTALGSIGLRPVINRDEPQYGDHIDHPSGCAVTQDCSECEGSCTQDEDCLGSLACYTERRTCIGQWIDGVNCVRPDVPRGVMPHDTRTDRIQPTLCPCSHGVCPCFPAMRLPFSWGDSSHSPRPTISRAPSSLCTIRRSIMPLSCKTHPLD